MHRKLPRSTDTALGYEIATPLDQDELRAIASDIRRAMTAQGSPRLLVDLRPPIGATAEAVWAELGLGPYVRDLDRVALIGDAAWRDGALRAMEAECRHDCRFFDRREVDQAWSWIGQAEQNLPRGIARREAPANR